MSLPAIQRGNVDLLGYIKPHSVYFSWKWIVKALFSDITKWYQVSYHHSIHQFKKLHWHQTPTHFHWSFLFLFLVCRSLIKAPNHMSRETHCSDEVQRIENSLTGIPHALLNGTVAPKRHALCSQDRCCFCLQWGPLKPYYPPGPTKTNTQQCPFGGFSLVWLCDVHSLSAAEMRVLSEITYDQATED